MNAKMLRFITVLVGLQVTTVTTLNTTTLPLSQATRETPQPSSTASTSTFSSSGNNSPSTASSTSALSQTNPTNGTSLATSIHQTETSSQPSEITTTDHTSTASAVTNSSKTTDLWPDKLVSVTNIQSSSEKPGERPASTGNVNENPHSEITTTDHTSTASAVTDSSITTDFWSGVFDSVTNIWSSSEKPGERPASTGNVSENPHSAAERKDGLPMNPGLVAILCIFFIVLALVLVVGIAKIISCRRNSQFERLEDLPMAQQSMVNENAPFARYPPK
ncbi:uncharacterized protein LOC131360594 [Hemibagrus wyckioides]|uniref:uncharacterized protein LOC131360594 n=1 Tax=Hemibagrus wyckioides TaxID=337641 RepID=UPI00266C8621|nr:uncharacterized protein LOC131360594 [Hemibagrus wyckioides]